MVCARIVTNNGVIEYADDDGEYSATRHIMDELRKFNILNHVVIVTRWASGQQLGKRRWSIIRHVTVNVLEKAGLVPPLPNTKHSGHQMMNISPQSSIKTVLPQEQSTGSFTFSNPQPAAIATEMQPKSNNLQLTT